MRRLLIMDRLAQRMFNAVPNQRRRYRWGLQGPKTRDSNLLSSSSRSDIILPENSHAMATAITFDRFHILANLPARAVKAHQGVQLRDGDTGIRWRGSTRKETA